jgi:hypothetical protein
VGTLTLKTIRDLIRSDLDESGLTGITDAELNSIINDGYKDTAAKGLCYESKITKTNISASVRVLSLYGDSVVRVNYVEYDLGTAGCRGMMAIMPQNLGHIMIDTYASQFWFQWGDFLVLEPLPDVATYDLNVYASCYPTVVLSADGDLPLIPAEFHECIYLYARSFACLKLRRWGDATIGYNRYIENIQRKKFEYIIKQPEARAYQDLPANVTMGK